MKQRGFVPIAVLLALAILIITFAGGVVVWQKKPLPTPNASTNLSTDPNLTNINIARDNLTLL